MAYIILIDMISMTMYPTAVNCRSSDTVRKAIETAKFYLFDVGVARAIQKLPPLVPKSTDFGDALEHFIFHELKTYIDARQPGCDLHYWRSTSQFEVDFILGEHTAIEVKATRSVSTRDLKGLTALAEEGVMKHLLLVCQEPTPRKIGKILVLPWSEFLERLWSDAVCWMTSTRAAF
jgi:predicted AAA+ superfamily ATPase